MSTKPKFTISGIKALQAGEIAWDDRVTGLGCRCQKKKKTFILSYRMDNRKWTYTIGAFGDDLTPEQARDEAAKLREDIRKGKNPSLYKQRLREMPDIRTAFQLYLEEVNVKRSSATYAEYKRLFEKHINKELGTHQVNAVTRGDISRMHTAQAAHPYQANRILAVLSSFFTWCERHEYRQEGINPCRYIEKYKEKSREPGVLTEEELQRLGTALEEYEEKYRYIGIQPHQKKPVTEQEINIFTPYVVAAIRLIILTGARKNEILKLKWEDIDFPHKQIRLQVSKTGQKSIYLSPPMLELLERMPRIQNNPYVFCGQKAGCHMVNIKDPWGKIRKSADMEHWRLHDFRHNYASTAVVGGYHLMVVGKILGHKNLRTTQRYAHLANDPVQTANDAISQQIAASMATKKEKI